VGTDDTELELDPNEIAGWLADGREVLLVDVRQPHERDAGYIDGSTHLELTQLPAHAEEFERDRPIVFYCRVGNRSLMAAQALRASGFEAYSMSGGLVRWTQEGRALSPDGGYVAAH
jgi:rhodanese-related sulfurtransferase